MKTYQCDCGHREVLSQIQVVGQFEICGDCSWAGVTAEQIAREKSDTTVRVAKNTAEKLAHVGQ